MPAATPRFHLPSVGSTNAEAFERAFAGTPAPFWITAGEQIAGRGRRGRTWSSPPGNLYASLLLADPAPPQAAPGLCFVAGLALADALAACLPASSGADIQVKWPNDVLFRGAKIAGILVEGQGTAPLRVVIGCGANLAHHPDATPYPATDLAAEGFSVSPDGLFAALEPAMTRRLVQWARGAGLAAILTDWRRRAFGLGGDIRVQLPDRAFIARFEDLDADGRLIVTRPDGGRETITAADVFPLTPVASPA
jgi:BirA family biotin operon repressor/biotin-[acetyl-CoA-carboxylase] ligase